MRKNWQILISICSVVAFVVHPVSAGDLCPFGEAVCIDYGAKVCKSSAKCVSSDAQCFDGLTCYPGGFVCKKDFDSLVRDFDGLKSKAIDIARTYDEFSSCVSYAVTIEDAKGCVSRYRYP